MRRGLLLVPKLLLFVGGLMKLGLELLVRLSTESLFQESARLPAFRAAIAFCFNARGSVWGDDEFDLHAAPPTLTLRWETSLPTSMACVVRRMEALFGRPRMTSTSLAPLTATRTRMRSLAGDSTASTPNGSASSNSSPKNSRHPTGRIKSYQPGRRNEHEPSQRYPHTCQVVDKSVYS